MIRRITKEHPLKILGFTDLHLDNNEPCAYWTNKIIRETVSREKPDLIVFAGDNVTGGDNKGLAEAFSDMLTYLQTPWCPILGNHEGDNPFSILRSEMADIFRSSPFCLLPEKKTASGETDYSVLLEDETGRAVHRLVFLDSGMVMKPEDIQKYVPGCTKKNPDDFIKPDQIAWYMSEIRKDECPSTLFTHVPLYEYREANENGELLRGMTRESICVCPYNSGLFAEILKAGKTVNVVCGHDHINDSHMLYKGIRLMYNRMSGFSSYNIISKKRGTRLIQGASVYHVHADGRMTFGDLFYEDMYPEYMPEIYKVIKK